MKIFDLDLLQLGITNLCNNNCIMCHQSKEWFKPSSKGSMNFNHAKKIIDDIYDKNIKFKVLHLFWKGEPFLNPDFLAILKYIMDKNNNNILFENLYINTNGTLLKDREEEFIDILNSNENVSVTVNFSIDACYVETYLKIRGKDYLADIENSLKKLIKLREENKLKNPLFIFQIVIQKLNADEVNDFVNKWQNELLKFNKKADFTYFLKAFENDVIFFRPLQPENEISRKSWLKAIKNYLPEDYEKLNETHIARIHANEVKKAEMPCFHL
ncbi:MAG: radical SAM protein, partial [Candidatus Muiribacteriota bacterium]